MQRNFCSVWGTNPSSKPNYRRVNEQVPYDRQFVTEESPMNSFCLDHVREAYLCGSHEVHPSISTWVVATQAGYQRRSAFCTNIHSFSAQRENCIAKPDDRPELLGFTTSWSLLMCTNLYFCRYCVRTKELLTSERCVPGLRGFFPEMLIVLSLPTLIH